MKAVTYRKYGPPEVLQIEEVEKPVPRDNEVLIRTHVTTATSGDWRGRSLEMPPGLGMVARLIFGITKPRQEILGSELAGEIELVGDQVKHFQPGDRVFVFTGAKLGCYVEYKCMPEDGNVVKIPDNLSYAEAATLSFGGTTALDFFRKGKLDAGESILINGASGGVGTMAVQLAKHFGAHVTGVCSTGNLELVKSLGADEAIDYTQVDLSGLNEQFDLIMDTVGTTGYAQSKSLLKPNGRLLLVMGNLFDMLRSTWVGLLSQHQIVAGGAAERLEDMQQLADLAAKGIVKSVIEKEFPVDQIVDAHRLVDTGRKKGSLIINWQND